MYFYLKQLHYCCYYILEKAETQYDSSLIHKTFTIFSSKKGLSIESNYEKISEFTIYSHDFRPFLPHFRFFSSPNRFMSLLPLKPNPPVLPSKRTPRPQKSFDSKRKSPQHRCCGLDWRRWRDLNSRAGYPTYTLSRGASSAS